MPTGLALVAAVTLALAGANLMQLQLAIISFFTHHLPETILFRSAFWLWLPTALVAAGCGLYGGYLAIRRAHVNSRALLIFVAMTCLAFEVNGQDLKYSVVGLNLGIGVSQVEVGVNVLGLLFVSWLFRLRKATEHPVSPVAPAGSSVTSGAV